MNEKLAEIAAELRKLAARAEEQMEPRRNEDFEIMDDLLGAVLRAADEIEAAATSPAPTLQRYMISSETRRALETAIETCRGYARPGGPVSGRTWDKYEGAALRLEALLGRTEASPAPLTPEQREFFEAARGFFAFTSQALHKGIDSATEAHGETLLAKADDAYRSMLREGEPRE